MSKRVPKKTFFLWSMGLSLLLSLIFFTQPAKADVSSYTECDFQPMAFDRTPSLDNILLVARGGNNISWDNTYIGLHRWNTQQWPGLDYVVDTTVPFRNGAIVAWAGIDGAGGGTSIMLDGFGPCEGWRVFYGHLNYDAALIYSPGDFVGPNDIIGKPGCAGFEDTCSTYGGSIPPHNHVILGYWQNIFNFDDGTNIAQVRGYWFIHPSRVEGGAGVTSPTDSSKPEITSQTEFVIDTPVSMVDPFIGSGTVNRLVHTFAPFKSIVIVGLTLLAIFWLGGIFYSSEFRRSTVVIVVLAAVAVLAYIGYHRVIASLPATPRTAEFVIDTQTSSDWTLNSVPVWDGNCSLPAKYPQGIQQWCPLIERWAAERNMDPRMIAAVMLQESGGDPNAYSSSGAVGLLQVMPRDGIAATFHNDAGVPYFSDRPSIEELMVPDFNIKYGSGMLERLGINTNPREALLHYGPDPDDLLRVYGDRYHYADCVLAIYENYR